MVARLHDVVPGGSIGAAVGLTVVDVDANVGSAVVID